MKKCKKILLLVLTLLTLTFGSLAFASCEDESPSSDSCLHNYEKHVCTLCGDDKTETYFTFTLNEEKTEYSIADTSVGTDILYIPETFKGLPVTAIAKEGFRCSMFKKIVIPNTIRTIGTGAFLRCNEFFEIVLPDSIERIESSAFEGCKKLYEIIIPNTVTYIGDGAFRDCSNLEKVIFPSKLNYLGNNAFNGCKDLNSIECYDSFESSLEIIRQGTFRDCEELQFVAIPTPVHTIEAFAFQNCKSLTSINNFNKLYPVVIDSHAFENCESASQLVMLTQVQSINDYAFSNCKSIESVRLPSTLTEMGDSVFEGCESLQSVEWENKVGYIPDRTFKNCTDLSRVTIHENVTAIKSQAFYRCPLETVYFPKTLTTISSEAFYKCKPLTNFTLSSDNLTSVAQDAFYGSALYTDEKFSFSGGIYLGNYLIDVSQYVSSETAGARNGTTGISKYAFNHCAYATEVYLPNSLRSLDWDTFAGCSKLTTIRFGGTVEEWNAIPKIEAIHSIRVTKIICNNGEEIAL